MIVRHLVVEDLDCVTALEASVLSAWKREQVVAELQRQAGISLVAERVAGELLGWCCGFGIGREAELLKVTVHSGRRRAGVACALLQALQQFFAAKGMEQLFLEVRSQNVPALALYAKLGFSEVGVRRNYYKYPVDDAHVLACRLAGSPYTDETSRKTF